LTTTPITFSGRIVISPGFKIKIEGLKFDFNVAKVDNSVVGPVKTSVYSKIIGFIEAPVVAAFALLAARGIDGSWWLTKLGITFINLDDSIMRPYDSYFIFFSSPVFDLSKLTAEDLNS